CMQHREIPLTF
nr:immunoglobulin light chain junction region [Macaca mulatta]MOW55804.1 immunoglobulin light chain junction region [Macaca mulatta]